MLVPDVSVHGICISQVCANKTDKVNQSLSVTDCVGSSAMYWSSI